MNLYLVVSEELNDIVCEDWFNQACHNEPYCICQVVVARNRGQATYLAWKSDRSSFDEDIREKPKFRTEIKKHDVDGPARIVTDEVDEVADNSDWLWTFRDELEPEVA